MRWWFCVSAGITLAGCLLLLVKSTYQMTDLDDLLVFVIGAMSGRAAYWKERAVEGKDGG